MSFCRITGRSRGLPKPNYFPLLAPISPADAKRCCRITGKSYGLPSHHYIPVLLASRSGKTKCKITNVSGELGPHHYSPEINYGNRKHNLLPGYRYIFPVLDGSTEAQKALIEMLSMKQITEDKKYVYTVDERRCSLVFCARMEAAVRDGDVRDVMLAKDSDTVLIKTKQGRNVSMDFKEFAEDVEMFEGEGPNAEVLKQRQKEEIEERKKKRKRAAALSSMKKIFENKEKLAEVQEIEEDKLKQDRMAKKAKLEVRQEKHDLKRVSYNNFDLEHMRSKSSMLMCNGDWRDQMHPLVESFDWDLLGKHINEDSYCPKVNMLPTPLQITPYHCEAEIYQVDNNISENSISLENVPCINPLKPIKSRPSEEIINAIREIAHDRLTETLNVTEKMLLANKMDMIPNLDDLPEIVKHIKKGKREKVAKVPGLTLDIKKAKKFVPGQHVNTPQGPVFIAGQTVETSAGPVFVPGLSVNTPLGVNLIPGHIIQNENNNESVFLAGQIIPTPKGDKFVSGQVIKNKDNSYRYTEGQTVLSEEGFKFVPGKIIHTCSEDVFVPGQTLSTPDGIQFIPGQTSTENGDIVFTPGLNAKIDNEWQFVPGQVVHKDSESHFIPGATLATPNGLKFIPGQTVSINGEPCFVPGITRKDELGLKFIPGTNVDTPDGPKFLEGQIIQTNFGEKFVPGKTITLGNGNVEFSMAKSIEDVQFSDSMPIGLPINIKTCSVSEESLYVFGHMVQTSKGIEFYPGSRVPKNEGKVVPGRLVKNDVGESRFVPGTMVEGIFVPGQIVFTENGEQFVPGQVVDTSDGPKFVPGQVVNTKSGPKFVPGQAIHTIDGPRFVPGQIIETKAGPTFIPGQVISTDEGSRFVPGQVVDTEEGPRFVPGRVIENDDNGVTFVPGQIVQTPEGLKFVAPDLIEGDEGLEFSVQSFLVTPEELKLLKVKTNPNDTTSTKGELTIDTNMLKQLSEAGMSIGRQVPAELPAINVILNETKNAEALKEFALDFGLKDTVANQLMDVIKSIIEMSVHLKTEIGQNTDNNSIIKPDKSHKSRNIENSKENESTSEDKAHEENIKNSIAAAVLAALVTAEQFQEINNNNGKEKYQQILKSIDTILGKTIDEDFVTAMYNILQKDDEIQILCDEILENTTKPKLELIRIAVNRSSENHSFTEKDIVDKFSDFLKSENEVLGPAFKNITKTDTNLLHHVLGHISEMISFVKSDQDAAESLQKAIVSAVQETSSQTIINMLQDTDPEQKELKELIMQSIGLARILGMSDVAKHLLCVLKDDTSMSQIANDDISMNILKRLTVMRKLAEQTPDLHDALVLLGKSPESARSDPKLRELVRESAALMIIPEEAPLLTSADVPLSLLQPENSLAMEDFLFKRKKCSGALLIMKRGLQAVVPREASRAVLTGEIAYTVLDENGIKYFEPLHVFSALNLSQPIAHRFSMYSCPIADEKDDDLQNYNGYCNISNSQITTRLGGLGRRYSNANPDRESTRNRIHSYDYTPSYTRYQSRSSTRSRSTCSKSPPKVDDVVVATSDYTAVADDEVSVKAGDIVEVLDTKAALGSKSRLDKELDVEVELLDSSAARHKIAVRPKKNHPKVKAAPKQNGERWLVRVLEDVQGDELSSRQGYVPAHVLREKEPERDITALAARRQAVIRELIETEEEFGRDMQQVVSQYMRPMDKATTPKPVFESREFLFSNFKQICEFHNTSLLEGIKYYASDPRMLGRALLRMEREFDKHVAYCRDEPKAQQLLSAHPVIKKYFQEIAKKVGDDKGLAEHLKLPIQRINDYQLLLKELVKYSKRLGDDSTDLQKALELFLGVPNRATNNLFIASIEGFRGNIYKLGRLLTHDWFTVEVEGTKENLYLFLFKARILISKIKRVADDRSVFVLQQIIRIPDIEIKDHPESLKFELHQKNPPLIFILKAQKEQVKTAWLREIRQYANDLVALAEHAADDLQVLPQEDLYQEEDSSEVQEETKKREHSEEVTEYSKEKKSRVEESEENKEEIQIPTKRKASLESDIATKLSKSEVVEASSDIQETLSTTQDIVTVGLESKSVVTQESTQVSVVQSITSQSQTSQEIIQEEFLEAGLQEVSASKEVSTTQTVQVHCTEVSAQGSVQEVVETACKTQKSETTVEASQDNVVSVSQQSIEKFESVSVEEAPEIETEIKSDKASKTSEKTSVQISSGENVITKKEDVSDKDQDLSKSETSKGEQKRPSKTKRESKKKTKSVDYSEEEKDVIQIKSSEETVSVTKQTVQAHESVNVIDTSNQTPSSEKVTELPGKEKTELTESVSKEFSKQKDNTEVVSKESALDINSAVTSEDKVVTKSQTVESEETAEEMSSRYSRSSRLSGEYSSSTRKSSTGGRYESSDGTGISTYSRRESGSRVESSRIDLGGSIEGSAASRYESKYSTSAIDNGSKYGVESSFDSRSSIKDGSRHGVESTYESRRSIKDGSKYGIESGYEGNSSTADGIESSYESRRSIKDRSKYDRTNSIKDEYGVESSYESRRSIKDASKYGYEKSNSIKESKYSEESEVESKIDSIAAKYGLNNNIETKSTKVIEAGYEVEMDAPSKIDSIASKYGRNSITESTKSKTRSTRLNIETSVDGNNVEAESQFESKRQSKANGRSVYEEAFSKNALLNGSVTSEYESKKSVSKSESFDGRPVFTKTLEGQNIEPGENALFECDIQSSEELDVTWLKDNKPLTDKLMDRVNIVKRGSVHKLEVMHCREDDAGLYTARAQNKTGNAHCTAQLIVHELTPEERKQKNALNAPYFIVALKDTEILLNTYLRFMVKVKGNPNPDVKFYREGKEITTCLDSDRVSIVRTRAEKGCYELVISDVNVADAGNYSCRAVNIYGEVESECTVTVVDDKNIFGELLPGGEGLLAKGEKPVFAWKRDGLEFDPEERFKVLLGDDEDSLALVFQHVKPEDAGMYTCVAKTSTGNISCSAELTVQGAVNYLHREPQKPTLEIEHREAVVSSGGSAMLELVCKGYPKPTVVWKHKGDVIEADTRHKFLHEDDENMSLVIKNVTSADSGVYEVTASNDLGDDTTTFNLVVTAPPKIKKKIENQICMVETSHTVRIEVEGTPAPEVSFYKDGVLITSSDRIIITKESDEVYTITIKDAKLTDSGSYSIVAKNEVNQCSDFWQWHVTSPPKVIKKLGESKVCEEKEMVTFEVKTEAEPAPTVTWFKNKTEIKESSAIKISSSGEAHKLVITSAARADAGEYSCEIRNVHGSTSDSCLLNVRCGPVFTQRLKDTTSSEGDVNVEFTVDVEAYPEPKVQWYLGDVEITEKKSVYSRVDNGSTHKLILKEVSAEMSGQYSCRVTNDLGADSCQATFTVNRKPRITKSLVDMTVDEGQTLKLEVEVEGCPEPKVKWYKDGKEVNTDARIKIERDTKRLENYHLTVTLVKEEDGGEYEVRAENEMGSVSCKSTVTVHTKEVHSRFTKETLTENELDEDCAEKQKIVEDFLDDKVKKIATKEKSKSEVAEEKSVLDDAAKSKSVSFEEVHQSISSKARKSLTEPESFEKKSVDDVSVSQTVSVEDVESVAHKPKKSFTEPDILNENLINEQDNERRNSIVTDLEKPAKAKKTFTEPEVTEEKELLDDSKYTTEIVDEAKPYKAQKSVTEPEIVEEKSFWDDVDNDGITKTYKVEEVASVLRKAKKSVSEPEIAEERELLDDSNKSKCTTKIVDEAKPYKAQKSVTEPEVMEEKSFWDDVDNDSMNKTSKVEEIESVPRKAKKSVTEPEVIETGSVIDENQNEANKKVTEEIGTTIQQARKSVTKPEIAEEVEIKSPKRKSIKKQSTAEEPLNADTEASPTLKESSIKDGHTFESLPLVYTVEAVGQPKPTVRWLHNGEEVKPDKGIHFTNEGDVYKLAIDAVGLKDIGKWQCEISNKLGKQVLDAELAVSPVAEYRKPIFRQPLEAQRVMQREPVTLKAICTADPLPHVAWLLNGNAIVPDATVTTSADSKELEHGLKECTFTLQIPTGRHQDTGVYTIQAKNQYGIGECSARLDILLRPEIEGLKDVTTVPYEETTFVANIRANPIAEVKWSKDGYVIQPSANIEINEDLAKETYSLTIKKIGVADAGVYTVTAKNEIGETAQQAKLTVHTNEPQFTKPLQKQTVKDYDDVTLKVRCDGVPKPDVKWYKDGNELANDERRTITTEVGGQVDSELEIKHFNPSDAGKYKAVARNLSGEASTEAEISLAQLSPGFVHKLDRQKEVDEGEPLELKAKVDGSPIPTAQWFKDGVKLPADDHVKQVSLPDGTIKLSIDHVTPSDCGAYKLIITNPNGEHSALCAVAINPTPRKPSFSQELEDTKVMVGQPVKLEARVMAFPAPEVKWFKDGLPIRPSQAVNFINQPGGIIGLAIDACKPEDAGVYSLTLSNKLGEAASKASVEVAQKERKPAFIAELMPSKVIEGFPVKMEVKVLGHPQPIIKWTHNGKEIVPDGERVRIVAQPDGTHALLLNKATAEDAGKYGVVAINDKGETASTAELSVASRTDDTSPEERPQFLQSLREVTADEGQPLTLSAPFVGNPVPEVSWSKDGQDLKPSDRILLTCDGKRVGLEINPVERPDAGVYSVKLVNPMGEDKTEGKIHVRKVFQPPAFTQKFTDLQQLPLFDAKFPARISGIPAPDVTWYKNGAPLSPSNKYQMKRDGDACCLYVRDLNEQDAGQYKCVAKNKEGQAECEAALEVVDKISRREKVEPPSFLKKIGDVEVFRGLSAKFTACATGTPEPDVEWFRNDEKLFPCERIRMDKESTGLLRLTISGVDPSDVGSYRCRIFNPHGEESCIAQLTYDTLEPQSGKKPISEQYSEFDKMKATGVPMPLADKPIISRMADRHLTLSWKPSIPHRPRFPVTYQVEMCEVPDGDWFTARTGLRSCVCDIRNLEPFRDYKFRVRVENKYGVSDPSPYAITHRAKLEPDPPKFIPYLEPGIDFRPETSPYFPKDFDIERPPHDGYAQAPKFLRQEYDSQYGVKGHNVNLFWFVYGYPKPKMTYYFNDEPIEVGGRYDWSYTRNGQAALFINKMLERDVGWYEAVATNEHGQARQRVRLELAEYPQFIRRPEESVVLVRKTARIEARVTGQPYPEIKWYKDWQPIAPSSRIKMHFKEPDTVVLVIHDVILKDEGLYSVSARNPAGAVSSSAMLHVEECEHEYSSRVREHPPRIKPSSKPFGDFYDIGDELGRGVQGVVYHAAERLSGRNYAAKIMHGHSDLKPFMKNELEIMNLLNDRHLVRLHDAYEHDHTLALVMELASGGELVRDRLLRSQGYTERDIAGYVRQLLRGLKHMHDNSIAHLGLTIGELLLSHVGSDELKICDFGLSRRIHLNQHAALNYGMPEFVAPEVAKGEGVAFGADMWSVGIITYILLSGRSPFRGLNDRETLTRVREGQWEWLDEEWWSRFSLESRDFISKLLVMDWRNRLDVDSALAHPWLSFADKIYKDEYIITTDRLRSYYNSYRDWMSNASCRTWFRRRPLEGAFDHPSRMVYPPGELYTPEGTPDRDRSSRERKSSPWDLKFKQWDHPDWEVSATSESHYQNGPDTYLLQLRDTQFPVRLREYMKVACHRSPAYNLSVHDSYDPRTPIIRERRRFTDVMDEEIDDERKERINQYGSESYTIRRLRHELGTRLDSYAEAQAFMESKKDGHLPFFREKPQILPVREGEPAQLSCYAVGDPKPVIQWFKNDMVIAEGQRIKIIEDDQGRSTLKFDPAMHHDIGFYKVVARNKVGQTVARTRIVEATTPNAPDSPAAAELSDTEVLLRWKQPKYDGNSPVVCYSLQFKEGDSVEWKTVAENIDHEFFVIRDLVPQMSYQFRLSSRNRIGWSEKGIPTNLVKTLEAGAPKIQVTKAMKHLQQMTESGQEIVLDEDRPKLDYATEEKSPEWGTTDQFTERYSFVSELWRGKFSIVVKGIDKTTDSVVVAKILECRPETEVQVQREFECLRRLRHERISNLFAAYQTPGSPVAALVLEKLQGADILTYLSSRHEYSEQVVATVITQVLDGLQYLHWRGYCHLDLQPDNVVLASVRSVQVKLVDFGSAHKVTKLGTIVPQVGELDYKAPEVINDEAAYPQTDIWSVGVLAYILLSGVSPFRGSDDAETKQNISFVRYRFEHLYKEITQEATRFLMFIFKKTPLKRPTAEECYEHRWLHNTDFMLRKRERAVFLGNRLKEFSEEYHSRKSAEASEADSVASAFPGLSPRMLARSNSIQDELMTNFTAP
ncbi:obscurin isoform X4 [Pieris brassicae]|uniref:obscurin isoform X4 n=1 Tax=Pieris brassicae TaxID=7116 RepID=UPI001E6603D2|nr:obscurin isoform X4 [Pieris brassicae]